MKYKDLTLEEARLICKKYRNQCKQCPLRREKEDTNKNIHLLFCYFMIYTMFDVWKDQKEELDNDFIKYEEELKRELEDMKK